jgi:Domain of unknown function (DUF4136)
MRLKSQRLIARNLAAAALLVSSSVLLAQEVTINHMPGTDFSKYHTYKWVTIAQAEQPNQIVDAEIKQAVDTQLAAKGLTETSSGQADLLVGYQTALHQQQQWTGYSMGGGWGWGGGMATATSSTINVGTLVLDMYDPATKQLVWTGRVTKTLDPSNSQEKREKELNKAMSRLLKDFPPK